jgi:hypothetical protein
VRALLPVLALLAFAGCGGEDKPAAAAKPSLTPFPTIDRGTLRPGVEYTTRVFKPSFRITLPEGEWIAASSDKPDHVEIERSRFRPPVQTAGIGFHHMTKVFPPKEGGVIPGDAVDAPDDFAAWLTSHPHLKTTKPKPVEALGMKGVTLDVTVKSSQPRKYKDCGKVSDGDCVVLYVGGIEPYVYGSQTRGRFLILEEPGGGELVIEIFVEPLKAFEQEVRVFEDILASATPVE